MAFSYKQEFFNKPWVKNTPFTESVYCHDLEALDQYQEECMKRYCTTLRLEQQAYLLDDHPEIGAMLKGFLSNSISSHSTTKLRSIASYFTRPYEELDSEIREILNIPPNVPYAKKDRKKKYVDGNAERDLLSILFQYYPTLPDTVALGEHDVSPTISSSFISVVTSQSTLGTPEPSIVLSPTTSEIFYDMILKIVDKATYLRVEHSQLLYDTAYVEIVKAVEKAMDLTVVEIKKDIATLLKESYQYFLAIIEERARLIAEQNWEKRMRKKLKRTLRRAENFRGYVTPPTPKSELSSHESYKVPPPPPCKCHPKMNYNRYPKDRFGIYLPRKNNFRDGNVTTAPLITDKVATDAVQIRLHLINSPSESLPYAIRSRSASRSSRLKSFQEIVRSVHSLRSEQNVPTDEEYRIATGRKKEPLPIVPSCAFNEYIGFINIVNPDKEKMGEHVALDTINYPSSLLDTLKFLHPKVTEEHCKGFSKIGMNNAADTQSVLTQDVVLQTDLRSTKSLKETKQGGKTGSKKQAFANANI